MIKLVYHIQQQIYDFLSLFRSCVCIYVLKTFAPLGLYCLYMFTLGMGMILIPSIDTVDTCELRASIDTSTASFHTNPALSAFYCQNVPMKDSRKSQLKR